MYSLSKAVSRVGNVSLLHRPKDTFTPNACVALYSPQRGAIANESAPKQLAQCRFPELTISNAKILIYFLNKLHGSNYIKQHSETVIVGNYQNADCTLRKKIIVSFFYNFLHKFRSQYSVYNTSVYAWKTLNSASYSAARCRKMPQTRKATHRIGVNEL